MAIQHPSLEQLSSLADGECSAAEARAIREHLFGCRDCNASFEAFGALDLELRRAPLVACEAALPLISARLDDEADDAEAAVAERHLESCASCSADQRTWSDVAVAIAALAAGTPSARVDEAIGAIARRERRVPAPIARPLLVGARALAAATVAVALVAIAVSPQGRAPVATQPAPDQVIVAAVQSVVLNEQTSTLYVLDSASATVEARDAVTSELKARIEVGGKPTALALNANTNTVLVLDASQKKVTEIDGAKNSVVSSASVPVNGTLTSISVEPNAGKILVTSTDPGSSSGPSGALVVIDQTTKQVETMKDLAVVPEVMIYDPMGHRAALVSTRQTTLLDENYKVIGLMPGGVAASFGKNKSNIAVLTSTPTGSVVTFGFLDARGGLGVPLLSLSLPGSPRAITAVSDGGFLVLVQLDKTSRVSYLSSDGTLGGDVDLPITGAAIAYDAANDRFTVVNGDKVVKSGVPTQLAAAPSPSAAPSAAVATSSAPSAPAPSASPSASPSVVASPSASPTPAPPVVTSRSTNALQQASSVNADVSRFTLLGGGLPIAVTKSNERLWVLDDTNRVVTIDMSGGEMFAPLRLPASAQISQWKAGRSYTFALDTSSGVLYVIDVRGERAQPYEMPQLKPVISSVVGFDDRLWMAVRGAPYLLAFDPKTGQISSFDLGLARVSLLAMDNLGRIFYADDTRHTVGTFDAKAQLLNEVKLPSRGATTGLVVDGSSTLWVSTTAGEIFSVRGGRPTLALSLGVPVTTLSLDQLGTVWYLAPLPKGALGFGFAALDEAAGSQVNGPVASLDFSALGRAWLADPRGGFFVSREQLR